MVATTWVSVLISHPHNIILDLHFSYCFLEWLLSLFYDLAVFLSGTQPAAENIGMVGITIRVSPFQLPK